MGPVSTMFGSNITIPSAAVQSGAGLSFGFSGSGFLIFYFTGIVSVLQSLGIVSSSTSLAGSSGGAITSAAVCSDVPAVQQFRTNLHLATKCRPSHGCKGFLDDVVREHLAAALPEDAVQRCKHRLFVALTLARPDNESDVPLLVENFTSQQQLMDAVAASAYLPFWSSPEPVTEFEGQAVYDGGFAYPLPCPPGSGYCVKVSSHAQAPDASKEPDPSVEADPALRALAFLTANVSTKNTSSKYLPLNPDTMPLPGPPDVYPGLSGPLTMPVEVWNTYGMRVPDNATLLYIYDQGRQDATAWAMKSGLATRAETQQALVSATMDVTVTVRTS
eukprot:GHRR01012834.1.p1 GENE.GHRR01012834.1~~GHRR01012834.1.p1  ORF type:complete len:332 (-),score=78.65 GHRR01012834.1:553-1548(-)